MPDNNNNLRVIITGATGMVGEGVLMTCLDDPRVALVTVVTRRPTGMQHPKLLEVMLADFLNPRVLAGRLTGYDACYFCLGVSSVGLKKEKYYEQTHTLTMKFAEMLVMDSPEAVFCYVSGAGTDSSERGFSNWARVKGKTENDLQQLPFAAVYAFRPGFIKPLPGQQRVARFYRLIGWMYGVGRKLAPAAFVQVEEIGRAMLAVTISRPAQKIIDGAAIIQWGSRRKIQANKTDEGR